MLTQPPVEAPADQRASQIEERLVDIGSPLVAYLHVPVAVHNQDNVRSTTHRCRPSFSLLSVPILDIRLLMLRLPRAFRHFFAL